MGVVAIFSLMKSLVAIIFVLPCLADPDLYNPFLGRFILRTAQPIATARVLPVTTANLLYQPGYFWQGAILQNPVVSVGLPLTPASTKLASSSPVVLPTAVPSPRSIVGASGVVFPNVIPVAPAKGSLTKVGELPEFAPEMHPMKGGIFMNEQDESQIIVRGFYYPQAGPDAFFWAGEDEPACSEQSIGGKTYLLAPGQVGSTDYFNKNQPILPTYDGKQGDLVLTLPPGASTRNLKWICVWCRKFAQNFGTVMLNGA